MYVFNFSAKRKKWEKLTNKHYMGGNTSIHHGVEKVLDMIMKYMYEHEVNRSIVDL